MAQFCGYELLYLVENIVHIQVSVAGTIEPL